MATTKAGCGVELRPAEVTDIPALTELIVSSARTLSRGYYADREIEAAIRHVFGVDSALIADRSYFVAKLDGAPCR